MSSPPSPYVGRNRGVLRGLLRLPAFRRLLAVRWTSQAADGVFQAGLAWLVLLSPERQQSPAGIAGAAALILLPFSLVGPFAGVLLDRWSRRSVLVAGQLVRVILVVALAVLGDRAGLVPVYALAIGVLAVNRFLLAAFSASVPSVVPRPLLLPANALGPTAGTAWLVVGLGVGSLLLAMTRGDHVDGSAGTGPTLLTAAVVMLAAAALALRIPAASLGPQEPSRGSARADILATVSGFAEGMAHLAQRREAGHALAMLAAHRFFFGLWTVETTLLVLDPDGGGGLSATAVVAGCGAAGYVSAALVTPLARRRLSDGTWVTVVLATSAAVTLVAVPLPGVAALAAASAMLGLAAQSVKICVDTAVQRGVDDAFLGRAFATYDVLFNVAFVAAAVGSIALLPDAATDRSLALSGLVAAGFAATAAAYRAGAR